MKTKRETDDYNRDQMIDFYMGEPEEDEQEETAGSWENIKIKPRQTRSERLQLLVTPELKKAITKQAKKNKVSINGFINAVLEAYIEQTTKKK